MSRIRFDQLVVLGVLCLVVATPIAALDQTAEFVLPQMMPIAPIPITQASSDEQGSFVATMSARSILVVDMPSGAWLLTKNGQDQVPPASTTKMMTALVARRLYDSHEVITIDERAFAEGNSMGLVAGEQITVESLLAGLLISSGNDAAMALAHHHQHGYEGFVTEMNQLAKQLHLSHTAFRNPAGLDDAAHYSTAQDLALVARELLLDERLKELVSTKQLTVSDISGGRSHWLYNTNVLLHTEPGVIGVKTGTTELAKENVITVVERNGRQLLVVVLGSDDRYGETKQLLQWIEDKYAWKKIDQ